MIFKFFVLLSAFAASASMAAPLGNCTGTPSDAIIELPMPLAVWGRISCTPYGHVIESNDGWIWSNPGSYSRVFMPAQMVRNAPEAVGNKAYFTKIALEKVSGDEFKKAYEVFRLGLDRDKVLPVGYRLDLTSVSGKTITQYFFDYGDSAWGIWCNKGCNSDSRFMLLNLDKQPDHGK